MFSLETLESSIQLSWMGPSAPWWRLRSSFYVHSICRKKPKKPQNKPKGKQILCLERHLVLEMGALAFSDCYVLSSLLVLTQTLFPLFLFLWQGDDKNGWEELSLWQWGLCCLQRRLAEGTLGKCWCDWEMLWNTRRMLEERGCWHPVEVCIWWWGRNFWEIPGKALQ